MQLADGGAHITSAPCVLERPERVKAARQRTHKQGAKSGGGGGGGDDVSGSGGVDVGGSGSGRGRGSVRE